jgi:hypothetical protein
LALSFGFLSKSKKSLMSGFGSKTYFHIKIQNIVTTPPTNVMDEMEYNVSLDSILKNGRYSRRAAVTGGQPKLEL